MATRRCRPPDASSPAAGSSMSQPAASRSDQSPLCEVPHQRLRAKPPGRRLTSTVYGEIRCPSIGSVRTRMTPVPCRARSVEDAPVAASAPARDDRPRAAFEDPAVLLGMVTVRSAMADRVSRPQLQHDWRVGARPLPSVVMVTMVPAGQHVPSPPMHPVVAPLVMAIRRTVVRRAVVHPCGVVMARMAVEIDASQCGADADRDRRIGAVADRRADQSTDDGARQRSIQRPRVIGPNGCRRHGRGEYDGGRQCDPADNAALPAPCHCHPPFLIVSCITSRPKEDFGHATTFIIRAWRISINR